MPGTPVIKGMAAIKAGFKGMMADKNYSLSFTPDGGDVAKSGDVAYTHGTYTATSTDPKTKKVMHEKGKYLTIFKKQSDGTWKAIEDSISNDAPPTPAK
jgi:ketosteroid isomerase-like protein